MRTRALGNTGHTVTELSLGTWGISGDGYGAVPEGEEARVIGRAQALGITLFETAAHYAHGRTERTLGEVLKGDSRALVVTRIGTDRTKIPPRKTFSKDFLEGEIEMSLSRLGGDRGLKVAVLLHNPSRVALENGALEALAEAHKKGDIASYGVSAGSREVAEKSLDLGAPIVSLPYNVFVVEPLRSLTSRLVDAKTAVLVHSVLGYGILTGRHAPLRDFPYGDHRSDRYPDDTLRARVRQLDAVRPLVSGEVESMRAAALLFALVPDVVSSVVLGPKNGAQLDQLVRDARVEPPFLSEGKLAGLEARLAHVGAR